MQWNSRVLPSCVACIQATSTTTRPVLGEPESSSYRRWHSPVWRTHCNTSSDENRHSRLHPSRPPMHNQMSDQSAYICMVARPINNEQADGFQARELCKRSVSANGTIDGFFNPVSCLGETCDGLVRTTWQSISHRNRLLLSMDREQTSWQPVFGERCLRPEGDLRICYHNLGQWPTIECSDISPGCNELWV